MAALFLRTRQTLLTRPASFTLLCARETRLVLARRTLVGTAVAASATVVTRRKRALHAVDENARRRNDGGASASAPAAGSSGLPDLSGLFGGAPPIDITVTTVMGFCSGYLLKRVSGTVAFYTGATVVTLQLLAKTGLITVHWDKLQDKMVPLLDANKDGRVTTDDLKVVLAKALNFVFGNLAHQATFLAGFAGGFYLG